MKQPVLLLILVVILAAGCRKTIDIEEKKPEKFTDLKIQPGFLFENFKEVNTSIAVPGLKTTGMNIVQIYEGNPASGGKLITTGGLNSEGAFTTAIRLPSRLTEVYIGNIASDGMNQYVPVPIINNSLVYTFGQAGGSMKSGDAVSVNDCSSGCTNTVQGTQNNQVISNGDVFCVDEGTNAVFNSLKINTGGILKICGTATINSYQSNGGEGTIIVTPTGTLTLPKYNNYFTIENYGNLNISGSGTISLNGEVHNWGTMTISIKWINQGTVINDGSFTNTQSFTNNPGAVFTNNCSWYLTKTGNNVLVQNGTLVNNGYISITGTSTFSGGSQTTFGLQSLMETYSFDISGNIVGPGSQGSQLHALHSTSNSSKSKINGGAVVSGYVDFWAGVLQNTGTTGPNVTFHDPGYIIPVPVCSMPSAPEITSSLVGGGLVGQQITPYVVTATGSDPITYSATNLPAGLVFNPATHTISGIPVTAGVTNIILTADNYMGTDTEVLVYTVTVPASPPVITSNLTGSTTVNEPYTYQLTASGTGPITYNASNLPAGLSFNPATQQITGTPVSAGVFSITLTATNAAGSDTETLVLTVGAPPVITSALTATGMAGQQFTPYLLTATGTGTITLNALNLPPGLIYTTESHIINGTPTNAGVTEVTLTAVNSFGADTKILVITIEEGIQPPVITSAQVAACEANQPFSYEITASGTLPITFTASGLPPGITLSGAIISGISSSPGTYNVIMTATNGAGVDAKTLTLTILPAGSTTDTDGDGVMDNLDAYPTDPTRAYNSYYPNQVDFGSLAYEDLWPAYGDYDCNDLVMNFQYQIVTNAQNAVVDLIMRYQVMAAGASLDNGFGIALNTSSSHIESVTGYTHLGNAVILEPKGVEAGHTNQAVIIVMDAVNSLLGNGMVNTIVGGNTVQTSVDTVTIHFGNPQASIGTPPYNPFIFVGQARGLEVHLKDEPPTALVDPSYFGTYNDASVPASGQYYRSSTGLPWAFEIPVNFDYPVESVDILQAYLHFAEWAQSSGAQYPDWYLNLEGYRNSGNIYNNY